MLSTNVGATPARAGGLQPLPAVQGGGAVGMPSPQFEARANVDIGPGARLRAMAGHATSLEDQRGDFSGDPCFTIELSELSSAASAWDEEGFSAVTLTTVDKDSKEVSRMSSSISISSEKEYKVLKSHLSNATKHPPSRVPDGIVFGASDTTISKFSLYPIPLLGKDKADVIVDNQNELVPFTTSEKNSWGDLGVRLSSEYTPQELASLIVTLWVEALKTKLESGGDKRNKKSKRVGVNIVVPSYFSQRERIAALCAVKEAGHTPKYAFPRALAAVMGALSPLQKGEQSKLLQLALAKAKANQGKEPLVLFVHMDDYSTEIGLLSCEGADKAEKTGNMLGFERIVLYNSTGICKSNELVFVANDKGSIDARKQREKTLRTPLETVLNDIKAILEKSEGLEGGMVSAVLCSGLDATESKTISNSLNAPIVHIRTRDVTTGGCLLAAAELESSKQYVAQDDENWSILHCLPIGEEFTTSKIFLREQLYDGGEVTDVDFIQPASRLWKTDTGPARKGKHIIPKIKREYTWGPLFDVFRKKGAVPPNNYALGWPKLTLIESIEGKPEQIIRKITPLCSKGDDGNDEAMVDCNLFLTVDTNTGTVSISDVRKDSVSNIRSWYWVLFQVGCVVTLIIVAVLLLYYSSDIISAYNYSKDKAWLTDFYEKNAPEKMRNDPMLIKNLMDKHHKKMFVLWRKLQQTYEVKWKPPYSIVETEL